MKFVSWLQVISGQRLPKVDKTKETTVVDPLVRVELYGVPEDTKQQETSYVENNGERLGMGKYPSRFLSILSSIWSFGAVHVTVHPHGRQSKTNPGPPYRLMNWKKFLCF